MYEQSLISSSFPMDPLKTTRPSPAAPTSLPLLSAVWLALCTGLVYKHHELLQVFFSFIASFLVAGLLAWIQQPRQPRQHCIGKAQVGLIACAAALYSIRSSVYTSLSIIAGNLAFDHWYAALYCQLTSLSAVLENAVTLSLSVVVLTTAEADVLEAFRSWMLAWILYKMMRLATVLLASPFKSLEPSQWIIHGVAYDLSPYVDRHPGGKEALMLGQGRDCTALFESYHPFTEQHRIVLAKHRIGGADKNEVQRRDHFYQVLCERVEKTLREKGIDPKEDRAATPLRTLYYLLIVSSALAAGYAHYRGSIIGSFLLAVFGWHIGALGHDAGHFAASRSARINDAGVWAMSLLCNPVMWQHQHTYAHHSHTNEFELDPDLHHFTTLLRVHRRFKHQKLYEKQSSVAFVILTYAFVVFGTCFWIPWGMMQEGSLYGMVEWTDRKRPLRALAMFGHWILFAGLTMALPFWTYDSAWWALSAVVIHLSTSGLLFALFSQINHLNEGSLDAEAMRQRQAQRDPALADCWAVSQVETSNNFATSSLFWHVFSNGLNLQIEHHLFPGLNHCHLHHIAPVVQQTCQEYGVLYKSYETWSEVFEATCTWLDRLSRETECS